MRTNILLVFFLAIALMAGFLISQYPPTFVIWGALAFTIFIVSFVNIEWGLYILIFSMLLSPEINIGETTGPTVGRGITLRLEDFLLIVIGFSWFAKNAVDKELGLFIKTPLNKPIFLYILACLVSTGFGIISGDVKVKTGFFFVLKYIEYFIVFFMIANQLKNIDQVKRFIFCILFTCFIVSIVGLLQVPGGERVSAPFEGETGEPNTLGGYLLFVGAVAAGLLIKTENYKVKYLLSLLIIVMIPPFLFTQSRSSYLGLIATCFILGLLTQRRPIIIGLLLIGLLTSPFFLPSQIKNRILFTFKQEAVTGQVQIGNVKLDTSTSARLIRLKEVLKDWPKHPIVGYGVTGYNFVDSQYPRVLIESGILGLLAFIYLLYSIFKLTIDHMKAVKTPFFKGLTVGFLAGFIGLLFHAIGANTFIIVRIMEPFWFFAGIIAVLPSLERQNEEQPQEERPFVRRHAPVN